MLRPLPPFRVHPLRKATAPKAPGKPKAEITIKQARQPVRRGRLATQATLRILPAREVETRA